MQLDRDEKGFSFLREGPLDMRMNPVEELTAEQIVNEWSERQIGDVLREYGEEPKWKVIAKTIVDARRKYRITTTMQLAQIIASCRGKIRGKLHPATLVFQALRICVNHELDVLKQGLEEALKLLAPAGKIGVISFHSLEDRVVKMLFKEITAPLRENREKIASTISLLTKKPIVPTLSEMRKNVRARSAKLRFVGKRSDA